MDRDTYGQDAQADYIETIDPVALLRENYARHGCPRRLISERTAIPEWKVTRLMKGNVCPTMDEGRALAKALGLRMVLLPRLQLTASDRFWAVMRHEKEQIEAEARRRDWGLDLDPEEREVRRQVAQMRARHRRRLELAEQRAREAADRRAAELEAIERGTRKPLATVPECA
jgi:hypothetical protein